MKTVESSPRRLQLTHFGWYYAAIAAAFGALCLYAGLSLLGSGDMRGGLIFILLGGGASLGLGVIATRKFTVTLDKNVGIVHVRNVTIFGTRIRSAPLKRLKEANLQTTNTGDLPLHRLVLLFHDREGWVVTNMYTSGDGAIRALEQINHWMHLHLPLQEHAHENHSHHA